MLKFVILLSAVACALGAAIPEGMLPQLDGRIVGGADTSISSFPYQVSLQRRGSHLCGASLVSSTIVVTAAHCMQVAGASLYSVRAGSTFANSGGTIVRVAAFKNHEGYNADTMVNDIAVIRLSSSVAFSSIIQPIALASTAPANGASAVVSGWGKKSSALQGGSNILQYVKVNIVGLKECSASTYGYGRKIKSDMICAADAGKDSCQGDSGGPLVSGSQLVGVVSWGYGCADANYPGVYSDVAAYRSWVLTTADSI